MDTLTKFIQSVAFDLMGLGFGAVAAYGLVTGRISPAGQETAMTVAGMYLGVKWPVTGP